jgi:enoyl-CoA hydratase/carnithine racemase
VYSGEIYSAETLERWNVVNRVYPDDGFDEAARAFARELAEGPTLAHGATKRIVRAYLEGGVAGADAVTDDQFGELFASEDLRGAVESFLTEGPDKARFEGR